MTLKQNQVVTINFNVKDQEGKVLQSTNDESPFSFLSGQSQILPKLEDRIGEMLIGSKKTVVLSPNDAYGEYNEEAVENVNRSDFPPETKIEEGMSFVANTKEGKQMPFFVRNVDGDDIKIDFNHPLAGQTLSFEIELLHIRDATKEELTHGHAHGAGGQQN